MRRALTPIIYFLFLFPAMIGTVAIMNFLERNYGLRTVYRVGDIDATIILGTLGVGLFFGANVLIGKIEKLHSGRSFDHVRQSSLFYILFIYMLAILIFRYREMNGALLYAMFALLWAISLLAIVVNAIFLWVCPKVLNEMRKKIITSLVLAFSFSSLLNLWTYYLTKELENRHL